MGQNPSFRDPFARPGPGGTGAFTIARDHFREQAERAAAKAATPKPVRPAPHRSVDLAPPRSPEPKASGFKLPKVDFPKVEFPGPKPGAEKKPAFFDLFAPRPREAAMRPEKIDDDFHRELMEGERRLPNGAALKVVARDADPGVADAYRNNRRMKKAARPSSLVLVSGANTVAAAEAAIDADFEEGLAEEDKKPKRERRSRSGGGGGGGSSGGGGGGGIRPPTPQIDRAFNQDDLVSVLIVLALLLLFGLFLIRGDGAPAKPEQLASIQSAPAAAPAPPPGPPPDPFGDQPKVLTPAPVTPVEPAPAPKPVCTAGHTMRAWFCTNEAQLTDKAKVQLEKELADWNSCFKDSELVVAGYADTRGPTEYNTWLGGERAKTIADFLKSRGIKVAQLQPVGELDGLTDNENCSNQRRVDIMFKGDAAEAPSRSCAPPADFAELVCG